MQTKAVAHPTDSHLLMRGIESLNRLAKQHRDRLRQSFLRVAAGASVMSAPCSMRGHAQAMR